MTVSDYTFRGSSAVRTVTVSSPDARISQILKAWVGYRISVKVLLDRALTTMNRTTSCAWVIRMGQAESSTSGRLDAETFLLMEGGLDGHLKAGHR